MKSKATIDEKESILYSEWVRASKLLTILIFLVVALLITNTIIISILVPEEMVLAITLSGVLCPFFILIGWNFRGIRITVTKHEIRIRFGLFNKKIIPFEELVSCEETKTSFKKYFGLGIRRGFDSSWAYVTDFGDAVKLTYQENKLFVFSTKNHQKICDLINEQIKL